MSISPCFFLLLAALPSVAFSGTVLSVKTVREGAVYAAREPVIFALSARDGEIPLEGKVEWRIEGAGVSGPRRGDATLEAGNATVAAEVSSPGFVRCLAIYREGGRRHAAGATAGVSPEQIHPALPRPEGFDAFWAGKRAEVEAETRPPVLSRVEGGGAGVVVFDLRAECPGGAPVSGYLALPEDAARGALPAILTLHGAGVRSASLEMATGWAKEGFLALDINGHGLPNGRPRAFYEELEKGELKDYQLRGRAAREEVYFVGMQQRVMRALALLAARPEWDGRVLVAYGTSQGGAQAIAGAALEPRVSLLVAGLPANGDIGAVNGRRGWPNRFIEKDAGGQPDPVATEVARWFDSANFAAGVRAEAFFTVGFADGVCPPESVYSIFNTMPGPKTIFNDPESGHRNSSAALERMREAVLRHAKDTGGGSRDGA